MSTVLELPLMMAGSTPTNLMAKFEVPDCLKVVSDPVPPPNHGMFRMVSPKSGDDRVIWDRFNLTQIQEARKMFNDLIAQGLVPYRVGANGRASNQVMQEFDPRAEEVIFLPPMKMVAGG
jgi:hypothetical protein